MVSFGRAVATVVAQEREGVAEDRLLQAHRVVHPQRRPS